MMKNLMNNSKRKKKLNEFIKNLKYSLHFDDDIIPEKNKKKLKEILTQAQNLDYKDADATELFLIREPKEVETLLPKKDSPAMREFVDVLAVALIVAFGGIRGLFFQPFKIPTSSMQPTLFGIHYVSSKAKEYETLPHSITKYFNMDLTAKAAVKEGGYLTTDPNTGQIFISSTKKYLFFDYTKFKISDTEYELPGTPNQVFRYINTPERSKNEAATPSGYFEKGFKLCDGYLSTGDHLFVDCFTHLFTGIHRGDVIVFNTKGIFSPTGEELAKKGYYYIKRLVALPGDQIEIRDNVLYLKPKGGTEFRPIYEYSEKFKKLYSKKGGYHGHLNQEFGFFGKKGQKRTIPDNYFFALGDNSINSSDGRTWGLIPRKNIVGRAFLIFWPFTRRWGLTDRNEPINVDTNLKAGLPAMNLQ
jgi:signal peptidase I